MQQLKQKNKTAIKKEKKIWKKFQIYTASPKRNMINENGGKVWTALCSFAFMMQFSVTNLVVILFQKHHVSKSVVIFM